MKKKKNSGFTLIEVLVVLSILSVFLISAVTISIITVRNLINSQNKILATRYAEGLKEWLKGEKETDWDIFKDKAGGTWCFNVDPITIWPSESNCEPDEKINVIFKREVNIQSDSIDPNRIIIDIVVSWNQGNETVSIPINTIFEKYE
ncbi:MAG: type II secretion system protein [bacterium]